MKIKQIVNQYRRDFTAIFICEGCGHEVEKGGYDDRHFHEKVIPTMPCESCGLTGVECGADYRPLTTKYPEHFQI